jgi:hypothetical protein
MTRSFSINDTRKSLWPGFLGIWLSVFILVLCGLSLYRSVQVYEDEWLKAFFMNFTTEMVSIAFTVLIIERFKSASNAKIDNVDEEVLAKIRRLMEDEMTTLREELCSTVKASAPQQESPEQLEQKQAIRAIYSKLNQVEKRLDDNLLRKCPPTGKGNEVH